MKKTLLIIAGSALVTGIGIRAAPALAQAAPSEVDVSVVRTADLDLGTAAGQRRLDQRLVVAAGEVCGEASDADLKGQNEARKCRKDVLSKARTDARTIAAAQTGSPILVASSR